MHATPGPARPAHFWPVPRRLGRGPDAVRASQPDPASSAEPPSAELADQHATVMAPSNFLADYSGELGGYKVEQEQRTRVDTQTRQSFTPPPPLSLYISPSQLRNKLQYRRDVRLVFADDDLRKPSAHFWPLIR